MPIPEHVLERHWFTAGHGTLWGTTGTYSRVAYHRLPAWPAQSAAFAWLKDLPQREHGRTLDSDENRTESFPLIAAEIRSLGFDLPEELPPLLTQPAIQSQIPTCTDCYLELSAHAVPLPGWPGSYAVRFMNDSQCCVLWYLLFQPDTPVRVLASEYFLERDIFDAMDYPSDIDDQPLRYEDVLSKSFVCAESLGEFLWRFCVENRLWFALHEKLPLAPAEQAYLEAARSTDGASCYS